MSAQLYLKKMYESFDFKVVGEEYFNESNFRLPINNRAFKYGDSFFETIKCSSCVPLFWEEHYFRIAGSLFMMKMEVPDEFEKVCH